MNTSRFFLAAILSLSLLAPGALPQATNSQAALIKQSKITFVGTVSQVAATSFAGGRNRRRPLSFVLTPF